MVFRAEDAVRHCCNTDHNVVVYIGQQCSKGSLLSSLVIPTTRQSCKSFAEVCDHQLCASGCYNTYICSNAPITRKIIKLIQLIVLSGNIDLTKNNTQRNMQKYKKIEKNQFVQL